MCSDKYNLDPPGYVPLQKYLEKMIDLKFKAIETTINLQFKGVEDNIVLARSLMTEKMDGFPQQFVRKGDSDVALTEIKAQVTILTNMITKIDLSLLMPRSEYNLQHQQLSEKIGLASVDIAEKTELARKSIEEKTNSIKDTSDLKFTTMEKRVQASELLKAEITGKIWSLGIVLSVGIIVLEFIIRYVLKV